jgi:hypothetical protein
MELTYCRLVELRSGKSRVAAGMKDVVVPHGCGDEGGAEGGAGRRGDVRRKEERAKGCVGACGWREEEPGRWWVWRLCAVGRCDAPGFQPSSLTLMIRSTELTLVKRQSTRAITSKTSPKNPNDPPWSTLGQVGQNPS